MIPERIATQTNDMLPQASLDMAAEDDRLTDVTAAYLRDIARIPLLTPEAEIELAQKMEDGRAAQAILLNEASLNGNRRGLEARVRIGNNARGQLIESNTRWVVTRARIARDVYKSRIPLIDLIQAGNEGLMEAVDCFEWQRGNRLLTFATDRIEKRIRLYVLDNETTIRIPVHERELSKRVLVTYDRLMIALGREPMAVEIAQQLGVAVDKVERIFRNPQVVASLESPVGEDGDIILGEVIEDGFASTEDEATDNVIVESAKEVRGRVLNERERRTLVLRFGLKDGRERTLEEIGCEFGVGREWIRQSAESALGKLRVAAKVKNFAGRSFL